MPDEMWYYDQNGSRNGPVDFETLQDLARRNILKRTDRIRRDGASTWQIAGDVDGLPFPRAIKPVTRPSPRMKTAGIVGAVSGGLGVQVYGILALTLFLQPDRAPIQDILLALMTLIALACLALLALSVDLLAGNSRFLKITGTVCFCLVIAPLLCSVCLVLTPASPVPHLPNILLVCGSVFVNFAIASQDPRP